VTGTEIGEPRRRCLARPLQLSASMLSAAIDAGTRRPRPAVATRALTTGRSEAADRHPVPLEGEVLDGRYCIEEIVGEGGMGIVVAARDLVRGQRVAMKT